jgi:hypothetical protein
MFALVPRGQTYCFYRKTDKFGVQSDDTKICVVMVGLPARGKSLIAGKGMYLIDLFKSPSLYAKFSRQLYDTSVGWASLLRFSM